MTEQTDNLISWNSDDFKPAFCLVGGELLTWKNDHWEDEAGNIVEVRLPEKLEDKKL